MFSEHLKSRVGLLVQPAWYDQNLCMRKLSWRTQPYRLLTRTFFALSAFAICSCRFLSSSYGFGLATACAPSASSSSPAPAPPNMPPSMPPNGPPPLIASARVPCEMAGELAGRRRWIGMTGWGFESVAAGSFG